MARLNGIIRTHTSKVKPESWNHIEEEKYGLGTVRTPEQFFSIFGIDTEKETAEDHLCRFVGQPMHKMFSEHLRRDNMGIDYSKITYRYKDPDSKGTV
mmetsp:Transcript_35613/g.35823  ORF Transcript_35613/g.35823 Transcript_35613/m.35823 type:complete len:98 (+) Transcript_35613:331-624(+)